MRRTQLLLIIAVLIGACGCAPRMIVRKDPNPTDKGVRYYRPKPYLVIKPYETTTGEGATKATKADEKYVSIELDWLPDFSEEYSINVTAGFGTSHVKFDLEDGWNLTGTVDQNLDSKTHENIKAISDAITGVIGATTKGSDNRPYAPTPSVTKEFVVRCTNVPLGYYEAVIANHCGRKRLCGWRYVGFAPFMACTTSLPNETALDPDLYGLVFKNGVMVFEPLNCIAGPADTGRCAVPATEVPAVYEIQNCQDCNCDCKDDLPAQQLEPLQEQPLAPADGDSNIPIQNNPSESSSSSSRR